MKKTIFFIITLILSLQLHAQSKVGTVDVEYIISQMPQLEQIGNDIKTYETELEGQLKNKLSSYQTLIDAYKKGEATYTEVDKKSKQNEIITLEQDLQKFKKNAASLIQIRQNELINPLYQLVGEAINTIATEEKFSQVLTSNNTIAYLDPAFDITIKVLKKLNLPLPKQN